MGKPGSHLSLENPRGPDSGQPPARTPIRGNRAVGRIRIVAGLTFAAEVKDAYFELPRGASNQKSSDVFEASG